MEPEVKWDVYDPSAPQPKKKLHPYVDELEITADMAEGTKRFAEIFNSMRSELLKNNLMVKK